MSRRVGGEGSKDAKIVIVGEAPGAEEEKLGRPFVGMAGQKLLELLTVAGISRSECYITNVVKVRPANNDISPYFEMRKSGVWTSDKYKEYVAELKEELCQVNANVIVPVGNVSLYALTGKLGITKQRGSLLECTLVPGVKVIPTIHPSAALRQYLYTHFIRADLVKVRRESEYKELVYKPRHLVLDPTYTQAMEYIANCHGHKMVAFDIEVVNEEVSCFSLARSDTDAISVPLVRGGADRWSPEEEREIILALAELLEDEGVVKLGQNFIFDCGFMYRKYGIVTRPAECTMIMMGIAYPDFPKGLDFICSMFTDIPYYKDDGKKYYKIGGDERKFWEYNAKDSIVCMDAYPKLYGVLEKQGNVATYRRQSALIEPLMYMQERGLRVDVTGLQEASKKAERQLIELDKQLTEVSGIDLNANSPKQLITYFYVQKGIKPYFKDGKMTTDDDAMRRLARKGIKEAAIIRDMRKIRKLKGTYFDVKLSADGRLRSAMNPVGARTGRLSSSEDIFGEGSNIQNLPGEMKKFIVPDDGYIMYNIDLSQAENRIVAYIAPEPLMIDAFETGIDVHKRTASLVFDKPMDKISDEPGSCELGTGEHSERFWGKKSNHSLNYAFGYKSFALKFDMTEQQANFIVERYHQAYPGVRQYHSWVQAKLRKDRTLTNCMGRNRLFLDRWGDTLFKEAYAHIPQSTVGDKINEQGLLFIYRNQDQFSDVDLLNQVHDSIVFQVPSTLPWSEHYRILYSVQQSLETLVKWHSTEFKIPADVSMCRTLKDMTKVDMAKGEEAVAEAYVKLFGRDKVELDEVEEEDEYEDVE